MRFYIDKILTHAFKFYEQKIVDKVNKMFKIASEQKSKKTKKEERMNRIRLNRLEDYITNSICIVQELKEKEEDTKKKRYLVELEINLRKARLSLIGEKLEIEEEVVEELEKERMELLKKEEKNV